MATRPEIVVVDGPLAGSRFEVKEGGLRLGRSSSNDIHIPDGELSRNHCLFEAVGESGISLTDLASANGTILNGNALGSSPAMLKEGDVIVVGSTTLRVGDVPAAQGVDLGLGGDDAQKGADGGSAKGRSPLAGVLWAVAALAVAVAIAVVMMAPTGGEEAPPATPVVKEPVLSEVRYERVMADSNGIFVYLMTLSQDGVLTVRIDDVPKENRHSVKSAPLSDEAKAELGDILAFRRLKDLDREYAGVEPDPPALDSWDLKVVYDRHSRRIRITNTQEPEAFRAIREKLEAFSKSELGIWAIQYPREKLIELAKQSVEVGNSKWEDRDVNYGNLAAAIAAYKEAVFYLETVNPKPDIGTEAIEGVRRASEELDKRYADQRFRADKALNLSQWESAKAELQVLLEMVPDRRDDRNRDARAKLLSAENNLKKKGGR